MINICTNQVFHDPFNLYIAVEIFLLLTIVFLASVIYKNSTKFSNLTVFIFTSLGYIVLFFSLTIINTLIFFFLFFIDDNPPSYNYHVLNAAIKNTCYLDPQKNHCPKTVDELMSIEPEHFKQLTKNAHLTYQYYPATNEYTLIVRNNNIWKNNGRVAIFDPRLSNTKGTYGYGVDFYDAEITSCNGRFQLINPPPFPGPWDNIN